LHCLSSNNPDVRVIRKQVSIYNPFSIATLSNSA